MQPARSVREAELLLTSDCTACEEAVDVLVSVAGVRLTTRDIVTDDALFARYAERIPVLRANGRELDWPFDAEGAAAFLAGDGMR